MPLFSGVPRESSWVGRVDRRRLARLLRRLLVAILLAVFALNILLLSLGIGRMGVEPIRLPFRLGGFIVFFQGWLIGSLYLILFMAWRSKLKQIVIFTILALMLNSVFTTVVTASRGALLWWLLQVFFLLIVMDAFRWRWVFNVGSVGVLIVLLFAYPVVTKYRSLTAFEGVSDVQAVGLALQLTGESLVQDPLRLISGTTETVFARVMGLEELVVLQQRMGTPQPDQARFFVLDQGQPIGMYYTREVLGIDTLAWRTISGTLGTFWLFGGEWLVVLGMLPYTLGLFVTRTVLTRGLPAWLGHVSLSIRVAGPVLAASWAFSAMTLTMEGDLIGGTGFIDAEKLVLMSVGLIMTETAARWIVQRSVSPGKAIS